MARKCPACVTEDLKPEMTAEGVEIDHCPVCDGIWLDRGELFHFSKHTSRLKSVLEEGFQQGEHPTTRVSPVNGLPLKEVHLLHGKLAIDVDPKSGGMWFDAGELKTLLDYEGDHLKVTGRKQMKPQAADRGRRTPHVHGRPVLLPLPNLALRSTSVLVGLYGMVVLLLIIISLHLRVSPAIALVLGVVIVGIQFLVSPFIMDLSLKWFYSLHWFDISRLPAGNAAFIERVCQEQGMKVPRLGIIEDGAPNAFTYGHTPNNARVVITRGILELLDEEEVNAVVTHELGHARHWDILMMTVASLAPLLLFYVYRTIARIEARGQVAQVKLVVMITSYLLYIISEYIVLWFSRTREYYADRFSGEVTGNPAALGSALVKIGYGLAGREPARDKKGKTQRKSGLEAIGAMGIFDAGAARALAVASFRVGSGLEKSNSLDPDLIKRAAAWDLWNPWATFYELHSTHPLIAKRIQHLDNQAAAAGLPPLVNFDEEKPESFWDEFLVDVFIHLLPWLVAAGGVALWFTHQSVNMIGAAVALVGVAKLIKTLFSYRGGEYPDHSVSSLLSAVKVSGIRPVPCTLRGTVIGKGVPGLVWSEDFVMRDDTGIMFLDYRQPLSIWEFLFGLLKAGEYQGREVEVRGWFRRAPTPFVEIKQIRMAGKTSTSMIYPLKLVWNTLLIAGGVIFLVMG